MADRAYSAAALVPEPLSASDTEIMITRKRHRLVQREHDTIWAERDEQAEQLDAIKHRVAALRLG